MKSIFQISYIWPSICQMKVVCGISVKSWNSKKRKWDENSQKILWSINAAAGAAALRLGFGNRPVAPPTDPPTLALQKVAEKIINIELKPSTVKGQLVF